MELEAAKLPDIVVEQTPFAELEAGSRIRTRFAIPQQSARHSQMHVQVSAVEMNQDVFGAPLDLGDRSAGERRPVCRKRRPRHAARMKMRGANHLPLQVRPNAAHNDFYFRKFWQLVCR